MIFLYKKVGRKKLIMRFKYWVTATKWIKKNLVAKNKNINNYYFETNNDYLKTKVIDRTGKFNKYKFINKK